MRRFLLPILLSLALAGCAHKAAQAPVPGSVDALDAYAYRAVSDAQAAITSVKTWQQCAAANFPPTVNVDGAAEKCDATAGPFPAAAKPLLNTAIHSYDVAQAAGQAYHAGASKDAQGLAQALTTLGIDISNLLTKTGGK